MDIFYYKNIWKTPYYLTQDVLGGAVTPELALKIREEGYDCLVIACDELIPYVDLGFMQYFPWVESLGLGMPYTDTNINDVYPHLMNVKQLDLALKKDADVSFLQKTTGLESLNVLNLYDNGSFLSDLLYLKELRTNWSCIEETEFSKMTGLINLKIFNTIKDINLYNIPALRGLSVQDDQKTADVHFLSSLLNLEALQLRFFPKLKVLPDLSGLKKLRRVSLLQCNHLTDISGLRHVHSLEELHISSRNLTADLLEPLFDLPNLKEVVASPRRKSDENKIKEVFGDKVKEVISNINYILP